MKYLFLVIFFCFFQNHTVEAQLTLQNGVESYTLDKRIDILRGANHPTDSVLVGKYDAQFKPLLTTDANYDFNEYQIKWLKINLNNQSHTTHWVLAFYNTFEKMTYYLIAPDGKIQQKVSGYAIPFELLEIPELRATFSVDMPQKGNYILLMQFDKSYNRHFQVNLFSQKAFYQERQGINIMLGIYLGICFIVIIYNLLFYFVAKDSVYILYIIYVLLFLCSHLCFSDMGYNLIWHDYPFFARKSLFITLVLSNTFGFLFFLKAFHVSYKSKLGIFINLMLLLYVVYLGLLLTSKDTSRFLSVSISLLTLLNFIIIYSISIYYTFVERRSTYYYFIALTVLFLGFMTYELYDYSVIPYSFLAKYAVPISSMFELLIISVGLSDTWRRARNEQRKAEQELIKSLQEKDRLRGDIARNLHDEVGATLSSISFMSEVGNMESKRSMASQNQEITRVLNTIGENSRDMLEKLDDIVWMVNPRNDSLENIILRMKKYAIEILNSKNMTYQLDFPSELPTVNLTMEMRRNLYLIFKEAINNLVKYADSPKAFAQLSIKNKRLTVKIQDWGKGFDLAAAKEGNGISNMTERAKEIGADFKIESNIGVGTTLLLSMEIPPIWD